MAEEKKCPHCNTGNVYILVSGKLVCRKCGYDERFHVIPSQAGRKKVSP